MYGGELEKEADGHIPNPKNSILARVTTFGMDRTLKDEDLDVFWPFFPFDVMPIKEGEHVYVLFEDNINKRHGLWVTRIPEPFNVDNLNLVPAEKKYQESSDNDSSDVGIDQALIDTEINLPKPTLSAEFVKEEVPDFKPRVGDRVINGSNNTMICLSRDRVDKIDSGLKEGSGTIHLVAGRADKDNFNFKTDKAFGIISAKTDIDKNLSIKVGDEKSGVSTVAFVGDEIRIVARKGSKVIVEDGDLYLYGKNVYHSDKSNNTEPHVLGETLKKILNDFIDTINNHTLPTPARSKPDDFTGYRTKG